MATNGHANSKLGALAGVAFALLLFFSLASFDSLDGATDQDLVDKWSNSGWRDGSIISMSMMLLAAPCFLVFITQLQSRLRKLVPEHWLIDLAHGAGLVFVTGLSVAAFTRGLIAHEVRFGDEPLPGPDTLRFVTSFSSSALGIVAIPFATIVVAATSILILQTGALSRWLGWLGVVVSVLSLVTIVFLDGAIASPLILIWVIGVSIELFRNRGPHAIAAAGLPIISTDQALGS